MCIYMTITFANHNGLEKGEALEYAIHKVQENCKGQELTGTCQLEVYTDNTHLFGKKTEQRNSTDVSKEVGQGAIQTISVQVYAHVLPPA